MQDNKDLRIDFASIVHDLFRQWWVILLFAASLALLTNVVIKGIYHPVYTTNATFAVTNKGYSAVYATDIQTTNETAERFKVVLESNILKNKVAEDLGEEEFTADTKVTLVEETNLIQLTVEDDSALKSYQTMQSIIDNYDEVSGYVFNNTILMELQQPTIPAGPSNTVLAGKYSEYAFVIGIVLAAAYISFFSIVKDTIKNESDAKNKVDAKLLGVIPHERTGNKKKLKKVPMRINNPILSMSYVESVRLCASRIRSRMDRNHLKRLMVTSVAENEGKSTVAVNLALALSQDGCRVLLVDCDFRKPSVYKILDVPQKRVQNLPVTLNSEKYKDVVLTNLDAGHLKVLLNGQATSDIDEVFSNGKLPYLLTALESDYDYIIIDTPPMGLVSDTETITAVAQASLLVVRQDMVMAKDINDSIDHLNQAEAPVIGFVFNDMKSVLPERLNYGYGGHNYYRGGAYGQR